MGAFVNYKPNIQIVADMESLANKSLEFFISSARQAVEKKGAFYVAVSGGYTPKRFFELLGEAPEVKSLLWEKIHLFWVDERCVSPDSQWSNYKLAADTFLTKVGIPEENVHRIPTEYEDFKLASRHYEETIRKVFGLKQNQIPEFDLIMLGMGTEGHTASLFPNSYALLDTENLACVVYVLNQKLNRITLTCPVLTAAAHLVVLVSGEEKADILKEVLTSEPDEVRYPIHVLWPILERVTWLVEKKAASSL